MNHSFRRLVLDYRTALLLALLAVALFTSPALAQDDNAAAAAREQDNVFVHIIKSVGIFWIVLLPISIWLIAMVVLLVLDLRMTQAIPPGFVEDFTDTVNKRKFKEAYDMVKADPSYLGQVMTSGMARLQYGLEDAREAALNTLEGIKSNKDQKNNYTAVIGTLGPLLGLVGTVFGMIEAFMELGVGSTPNPAKLASGIAHALSITLIGVAIAVPAIAANAFFRNRITQVTLEISHVADDLLTQMYHNSKKPAGPAPVGPAGMAPVPVAAAPVAPVAPVAAPRVQ